MWTTSWLQSRSALSTITCFIQIIPAWLFKDSPLCRSLRNHIWGCTWRPCLCTYCSCISWIGLFHNCAGSLLICNPIQGKEEVRNQPSVLHIHHQSWTEAHLEREHDLTKHLLHKINASRLLPVQVPLRGPSDLNYQECYRKQRASLCSLRQQRHGNRHV